jgi:hypothetical protein
MPGTLTKADIITAIQTENGYSRKKSTDIVDTFGDLFRHHTRPIPHGVVENYDGKTPLDFIMSPLLSTF